MAVTPPFPTLAELGYDTLLSQAQLAATFASRKVVHPGNLETIATNRTVLSEVVVTGIARFSADPDSPLPAMFAADAARIRSVRRLVNEMLVISSVAMPPIAVEVADTERRVAHDLEGYATAVLNAIHAKQIGDEDETRARTAWGLMLYHDVMAEIDCIAV